MSRTMAGCTMRMESQRRVCLDDEPIYCTAPSPSNTDDIICPGSDDETDEATIAAKRLRYEEYGRHYLEGGSLRIFSASLRGPFHSAAGWHNPWLPQPSLQRTQRFKGPSPPPVVSALQSGSDTQADGRPNEGNGDIEDLGDSMECHLPSPNGYEELEFLKTPSQFQRRTRIELWAENVCEVILEKDKFWAPNQPPADCQTESTTKRPAGSDWLKRRPLKKRKPGISEGTTTIYTSTPTPAAQPKSKKRKELIAERSATRSFEMATPSSSPPKGPVEPLDPVEAQSTTSYGKDEHAVSMTMSSGGNQVPAGPPIWAMQREEGGKEAEPDNEDNAQSAEIAEDLSPLSSQRKTAPNSNELTEVADFQDCADESFCYRARPSKQDTHQGVCNEGATECSSLDKRRETSIPHQHDNMAVQSCDHTEVEASIGSNPTANTGRPLGDISSKEHASRLNIYNSIPRTMLEMKDAQSEEVFCDEGPTLIGDLLDVGQPGDFEPVQRKPDGCLFEPPAPLQHDATSSTNGTNTSHEAIIPTKSDDAMNCVATVTPQSGATELQTTFDKPARQSPQKETTNPVTDADGYPVQGDEDFSRITNEGQAVPAEQKSPWVSLSVMKESVQLSNKMEHAEAEPRNPLALPIATLPSSPALAHCSPAIRPSQQSPWAQMITNSVDTVGFGGDISANTRGSMGTRSSTGFHNPLVPPNQGQESSFASLPAILSQSDESSRAPHECEHLQESNPVAEEGRVPSTQDLPNTPIPKNVQQTSPDGEVSIRSFSNFNFSPPQPSTCPPGSSTSRSILGSGRRSGTRSARRVSFAPLPHEYEDNDSQPCMKSRASSPPPSTLVDLEEENIDGKYRNHFELMNRRISVLPNLRYYQHLLPSSSQQKLNSPAVEAMANAFREADTERLDRVEDMVRNIEVNEGEEMGVNIEEMTAEPQSPWQHDSQGIDDVAAVMGNLREFLDVWDVDTEMNKNRSGFDTVESHEVSPNTDTSILQGVGIW